MMHEFSLSGRNSKSMLSHVSQKPPFEICGALFSITRENNIQIFVFWFSLILSISGSNSKVERCFQLSNQYSFLINGCLCAMKHWKIRLLSLETTKSGQQMNEKKSSKEPARYT